MNRRQRKKQAKRRRKQELLEQMALMQSFEQLAPTPPLVRSLTRMVYTRHPRRYWFSTADYQHYVQDLLGLARSEREAIDRKMETQNLTLAGWRPKS